MNLPFLFAACSVGIFGTLAIYFSWQKDRLMKLLKERERVQKRRLYEISVLRSIQERIGYSLDIDRVIDTLTSSLKNLFPYSTVSSLVVHDDDIIMKTHLDERIGTTYLTQVKKSMLASLTSLLNKPLPHHIEDVRTGLAADDTNLQPLGSFFHIPLILHGQVVGLISICSVTPGLYKEEDMTIMYQLTALASNALSKLQEVITIEEEKLVAMITSIADGIVMIDKSYQLTFVNQSAKTLLGIPHLPTPTIFDVVNMLSQKADFGQRIKEVLSTNKSLPKEEITLADKTVEISVSPVLGPIEDQQTMKRSVMGCVILMHDVTLEKGLQKMKEDFTNAVVHELRSPLSAIKAATEMMIANPDLPRTDRKLAAIIEQQSKRLLTDTNSLLDAAKLEAGHFTVWQTASDIAKVATDTLALFQPEASKKGVMLDLDIQHALPQAFIDPRRIEQVLNNLISNSLKFTPQGGNILVKIVSQYNEQLPKTSTNPGILVSVSDTGIGIPEEKQKDLFEKFASITKTPVDSLEETTTGTGLGLYIARGIVAAHGGNIYVSSRPHHGTTVFFTVPIASETKPLFSPTIQNILRYSPPQTVH